MRADVYKAGILAAELISTPGGTEFRYHDAYLASPMPAVATTLPKTSAPVATSGGAVPPFFTGLLPEGRRLSVLRREIKASADDELALLLAVGRDTVGDVQVVPQGEPPDAPVPALELPADIAQVSIADLVRGQAFDRVAIPGVQDKFSGAVINLPGRSQGEQLIVKLDPPEYPHVTRNEAAFLHLARHAGLNTPEWRLVEDRTGMTALLVRRFDRLHRDGAVISLAVEDATQILGLWPADKYRLSYEAVIDALASLCAAEKVARLTLFRQVVFAWVSGNGDAHGKNFSLLADAETGEWRVSPAYDLPSTVVYGDLTLALGLAGRVKGISRRIMLEFAGKIGLPARLAERTLDAILARTAPLLENLASLNLPYSRNQTRDWQRELNYRRRLLTS